MKTIPIGCEIGTTAEVLEPPYHPYTRMLLDSAADNEPAGAPAGTPTAPAVTSVCGFAARCPHKLGSICDTTPPPVRAFSESHVIACHLDTAPSLSPLSALRHPRAQRVAEVS
jgi:peptide/nickel transport system ATP-binding protein